MHKIILIILATVVNETAAGYDQSKLASNHIFIASNQYSKENKYAEVVDMGANFYRVNPFPYLPAELEPSWNLFANFKPGAVNCYDAHKMSFGVCEIIDVNNAE